MKKLAFGIILLFACGAAFGARRRAARPRIPTFSKEVVRIFQQNCQSCHHEGGIGPFSLTEFASAAPFADGIRYMTETRQMPPWKPSEGCGDFKSARRLSDADIDTIASWVDAGAPEGNPSDLPRPLEFSTAEWTLGRPDAALRIPVPYTPTAAEDSFRCYVLGETSPVDRYVSAIDFRPTDREHVHHVIAYIDSTGKSLELDAADPAPGYDYMKVGLGFDVTGYLGIYVPNADPFRLPDGVAIKIPANSRIVLLIHYHPHDGEIATDQTEVGLYFTDRPVKKLLRFLLVDQPQLFLPAGQANVPVSQSWTVPADMHLHALGAHMHYLGKKIRADLEDAAGSRRCLLQIDDWDLHWQGMYQYQDPAALAAGSVLKVEALYDNSSGNPSQQNHPPKDIRWGEPAMDEMCSIYGAYTLDEESLSIVP